MDNRRRKSSLMLASALALLCGCEGLVPYHSRSGWQEQEEVHVVLRRAADHAGPPLTIVAPGEGSQRFVALDPALITSRLNHLLRDVAAISDRPPSGWTAVTAGEFYASPPKPRGSAQAGREGVELEVRPAIQGFTLERWVKGKVATSLEFSLEPANGAFRVVLNRITVHLCRAKVADMSWRQWWSRIPCVYGFAFDIAWPFGLDHSDQAVDMGIDLAVGAVWTDARGQPHSGTVAACHWTVLDVPILGESFEVRQCGGFLPPIPASVCGFDGVQPVWGLGNFTLHFLVMEQDDMSAKTLQSRNVLVDFLHGLFSILPIPLL